ncbi:ankyrin [Nemania abortiva]|nr:ankyrin [Nemania abortiva]
MDPLSVTASVIAIVGTLGTIKKGYKTIASLSKAFQEFNDLVNEIESVHAYLEMLHSVLDMGSSTQAFAAIDLIPLGAALSRLEYTIRTLQSALKQVETDSKTGDGGRRISKLKWQVYKPKVIQLRDEVRHGKQDLVDKIGLLQLALSMVHAALLPSTYVSAEISYPNRNEPSGEEPQPTTLLNDKQNGAMAVGSLYRIRQRCSASCSCRCHRPPIISSRPWLLSTIRQLLSLCMTTVRWEPSSCDDRVCRNTSQRKIDLVYQIPLFHYAVWLRLAWTSVFGPGASLHLRVARVITDTLVFDTAKCGTPRALQYLFAEKRALPNDTTPSGQSLLLLAFKGLNYEMIDYLLELGVDASQPDCFGVSPVSWAQYYTRNYPHWAYSRRLQVLVEEDYNSKSRGYPVHEALVRDTDAELELTLNECYMLVNEQAEFNYTPLHTATRLKRHSAMELLLLRGADPLKPDVYGYIPLIYAVSRNDYRATEILLRATHVSDNVHLQRHLIHTALRYSSSRILALLLSSSSNSGQLLESPPLWYLTERKPCYCQDEDDLEDIARYMLESGLDLSSSGVDVCARAVARDNFHLLRVLLKLGTQFYHMKEGKWGVLHYAATYATLDTIEVLRKASISTLDPDAKAEGFTAMDLFEERETCRDEWLLPRQKRPTAEDSAAFRTLINEVRERYEKEKMTLRPSGQEDGGSGGDESPMPGSWVE